MLPLCVQEPSPESAGRHRPSAALVVLSVFLATGLLTSPAGAGSFPPDQPFASFWFPNELLSWTPATDPDAPYNRASVPLHSRFYDAATQVNGHAREGEAKVNALSVMFPTTSNNPSQGSYDFDIYAFGYWQYLDHLVFWGGSAGEGLILAPNPGVIDSAHKHGVKVLGNIFFPPNAFGGNIQWVRDFVQTSGETFPVADKLIEVAEYYGFDGWFINQETAGGDTALATDLRDLIRYIRANSSLEIQWYDAMIETGQILYQNSLTTANDAFLQEDGNPVSHSMFLNYNWSGAALTNSGNLATSLGRGPYDLFAGVNVGNSGFNTVVNWAGLFPEAQAHRTSLGFFATHWTFQNASTPQEFYQNARIFWSGPNEDPSNTTTADDWKGVAYYVPAASSIDAIPFVTHFDTGQGELWAAEGEVRRMGAWHQRGLQDIQPTWRWIVDTTGTALVPELVWDTAWEGGTSLRVSGDLDQDVVLDLFKTRLSIVSGTTLRTVFKMPSAVPSQASVLLYFDDGMGGIEPPIEFDLGAPADADWTLASFDLSPFAGETISKISLGFADGPTAGYSIHFGQLAVIDGTPDVPMPPTGLVIESKDELDAMTATLRLRWDGSPNPVNAYHVYRHNPDDSLTWLGGTANTVLFVPRLDRLPGEPDTTIEVEAVGSEGGRSTRATTFFVWDDPLAIFADGFESGDTTTWSSSSR